MSWMQTYTGTPWYPATPHGLYVNFEDIAHALSHLCRYGGHCRKFYSVAEHSVLVSYLVPERHAFAGLMHDATEAYVVDVPRPLKMHLSNYKELEAETWRVIADKYGLPVELDKSVHQADIDACYIEKEQLMRPCAYQWMEDEWGMGTTFTLSKTPAWVWELGLDPESAKRLFTNRFKELTQ